MSVRIHDLEALKAAVSRLSAVEEELVLVWSPTLVVFFTGAPGYELSQFGAPYGVDVIEAERDGNEELIALVRKSRPSIEERHRMLMLEQQQQRREAEARRRRNAAALLALDP